MRQCIRPASLLLAVVAQICLPLLSDAFGFHPCKFVGVHRPGANRCRQASRALRASGADGELIFSTSNELNGEVQVRELAQGASDDQAVVRALWFSGTPGVWQSAVQMRRVGDKVEPDWSVLPFPSSRAHAFASALVEQPEGTGEYGTFSKTAMVLGLGGGTLAGWLLSSLPEISLLTCSELDADVLKICTSYFGLDESDARLTLQLGDGLEHAAQAKTEGKTFDLVAVDVGSLQAGQDTTQMLAPPPSLRTPQAMSMLSDVVAPGGVLSMTIVGGSDAELLELLDHFQGFDEVCYLENRASEKWLSSSASVRSCIALGFKSCSPSWSGGPRASRAFLRQRAKVFDAMFPPSPDGAPAAGGLRAAGAGMSQRVSLEFSDVQGLRTRVKQLAVFRESSSESNASESTAPKVSSANPSEGRAGEGWRKEKERSSQTKESVKDEAYMSQLSAFRCDPPNLLLR